VRSDVLGLHLPLTQDTEGPIDARAISTMTPGLVLINTARGTPVDTAAVYLRRSSMQTVLSFLCDGKCIIV
jgi:phosphoglycerate dehydrogenase-like enzyme